jgi:hypothetical protein
MSLSVDQPYAGPAASCCGIIGTHMCCSSTQRRRAFTGRHVFVLASSSGLRGHKRTYLTILELADHVLFKMVRYVLLRRLWPELDAKTKTCLAAKTRFCHLDEQANSTCIYYMSLQYRNKSKCQLTSPMPAQLPAVAVSSGHIVC